MTRVVGLTGGIATGKSTVGQLFEQLGAVRIDADAIVHELQVPGSAVLDEIVREFGPEVLDARGALDRAALAAIVFRDERARARLNAIVHPRVATEIARRVAEARAARAPLVVLDVPLLLEASRRDAPARFGMDAIVVVYASEETQIRRQMQRDGCERSEAERRVRAQLPIEEKRRLADFVIDNSGSREQTERQVRSLYRQLTAAAEQA